MFTEASGFEPGDRAFMKSPTVRVEVASCFSVYYMMYGRDIDTFSIYRLHNDGALNLLDSIRWSQVFLLVYGQTILSL